MNMRLISKKFLQITVLLSCFGPQIYGMESNSATGLVNIAYNTRYNATSLFGDSEQLGKAGRCERYNALQRELLDLREAQMLEIYDAKKLPILETLAKHGPIKKRAQYYHTYNIFKTERNILARDLATKKRALPQGPAHEPRATLIKTLQNEFDNVLAAAHYFGTQKTPGNKELEDRCITMIKNIYMQHWAYTNLSNLNMPENINIRTKIKPNHTLASGSASKNFGGYTINSTLADNSTLDRAFSTLAHEMGHILYGDTDRLLLSRNGIHNITAITSPFVGYLSAALIAAATKNTKSPRALASLALTTAATYYGGGQALGYKISQARELRADTFAYNYLLKTDNSTAVIETIFENLLCEDAINNSDLEAKAIARFGTHPRPLTRALNGISVLEENGIAFDEKLVAQHFTTLTPIGKEEYTRIMKKYLPQDLLKKANIQ